MPPPAATGPSEEGRGLHPGPLLNDVVGVATGQPHVRLGMRERLRAISAASTVGRARPRNAPMSQGLAYTVVSSRSPPSATQIRTRHEQ